jgi:hypothetical protein
MSIATVLTSLASAIELAGKARKIAEILKNVELKSTLSNLSNNLVDAKLQAVELKNQMAALTEENAKLKKALKKVDEKDHP